MSQLLPSLNVEGGGGRPCRPPPFLLPKVGPFPHFQICLLILQ